MWLSVGRADDKLCLGAKEAAKIIFHSFAAERKKGLMRSAYMYAYYISGLIYLGGYID